MPRRFSPRSASACPASTSCDPSWEDRGSHSDRLRKGACAIRLSAPARDRSAGAGPMRSNHHLRRSADGRHQPRYPPERDDDHSDFSRPMPRASRRSAPTQRDGICERVTGCSTTARSDRGPFFAWGRSGLLGKRCRCCCSSVPTSRSPGRRGARTSRQSVEPSSVSASGTGDLHGADPAWRGRRRLMTRSTCWAYPRLPCASTDMPRRQAAGGDGDEQGFAASDVADIASWCRTANRVLFRAGDGQSLADAALRVAVVAASGAA